MELNVSIYALETYSSHLVLLVLFSSACLLPNYQCISGLCLGALDLSHCYRISVWQHNGQIRFSLLRNRTCRITYLKKKKQQI